MGLLDHLWDETVAGPRPDSGLGKLRKYSSFSSTSSSSAAASAATAPGSSLVTRSITILRTTSFPRSALDSASSSPSSPASVPDSPLTPTGLRGEWWRLRKKPTPAAEGMETAEPRNPDVYDWVLISSLDR